jgi:TRAP-type C4-dicarboxylate transport system substrate-binding protein
MALANQAVWAKLTEAQRARILALLVRMLLQQVTSQQEDKPA